jgi:hypothetical protein
MCRIYSVISLQASFSYVAVHKMGSHGLSKSRIAIGYQQLGNKYLFLKILILVTFLRRVLFVRLLLYSNQ